MSKNYRSIEWKTAVCLVFSVFLHAGLIYYVALTQFGGGSSGVNSAGEFAQIEITPIPVSNETPDPAPVAPVKEPKVEVSRPVENKLPAPKPKLAQVLPKKAVITPAPQDDNSKVEAPVEVAKIEPQPEPVIEQEKMDDVSEATVAAVETMNVEKEVKQEQKAREELVEKIMKDEPLPERDEKAQNIVATPAAAGPAVAVAAAPAKQASAGAPLPVKNDYELKAMPGNKDPQYSPEDRLKNRQGEVKFMAEVSSDGSISNIRILKSSGHRSLDLAAYSAFKNYRYFPGQQSYVVKSFVFTLKGPAQVLPSRLGTRTQAANK
jgi:periplasmic protein TonB